MFWTHRALYRTVGPKSWQYTSGNIQIKCTQCGVWKLVAKGCTPGTASHIPPKLSLIVHARVMTPNCSARLARHLVQKKCWWNTNRAVVNKRPHNAKQSPEPRIITWNTDKIPVRCAQQSVSEETSISCCDKVSEIFQNEYRKHISVCAFIKDAASTTAPELPIYFFCIVCKQECMQRLSHS